MIVLGLDFETTGLDKVNDRPIEVGLSLWSTNYNRSIESRSFHIQSEGVKIPADVMKKTGITQKMIDAKGWDPTEALEEVIDWVTRAEAIVAFNGRRFDIPLARLWAKRLGKEWPEKFIIDPTSDLPETNDAVSPGLPMQKLITMCAEEGIYYSAHEAGADVSAMLRLMATRRFDFVLQRAESPVIVVQSHQRRNENDLVKKHKFRWNPDNKIWWKAVKEIDVEQLHVAVNNEFPFSKSEYTVEELDGD